MLKEMSLSSYYDEVALKGLELAARDLARGVLTRPQVECIKEAVMTLVTELADYDDVDPGTAPWPKRPLTEAPHKICPSIRPPPERCPRA